MVCLVAVSSHLHFYQDALDPVTMFNHYRKQNLQILKKAKLLSLCLPLH